MTTIQDNLRKITDSLPSGVGLVVVVKSRSLEEIKAAIDSGASIIGENYIQEAERIKASLSVPVNWHFIGHLQKNKVKKAVELFDMIETVDSIELAGEIDKRSAAIVKVMPVLIEVNSGAEPNKTGAMPEDVIQLAQSMASFKHVRLMGLMTMGPLVDAPEDIRPYFRLTRQIFEDLKKLAIPNVEMCYLSMGMTESYKIAVEEGANLVRIGRAIFSG
jgi:pyridoxal phosphate enzyme (YggS family)